MHFGEEFLNYSIKPEIYEYIIIYRGNIFSPILSYEIHVNNSHNKNLQHN